MKLYHYVPKGSKVMQEGLLSFAKSPYADINYYVKRSGQKTKAGIIKWMESCFKGRSRAIRFFATPLKWTKKCLRLKELIDTCDLLEIDIDALEKDGLIEKVFFKPSVFDKKYQPPKDFDWNDEYLVPLKSIHEIDFNYKQTWDKCDDSKGLRMAPLRFHVLVIKGGVIPHKYITFANKNTQQKKKAMKKVITLKDGRTLLARQIKGTDYDDVMDFLDKFSRGKGAHWTNQYPGQPKRNKEACVKLYDSSDALFIGVWDGKKLIGFGSLILGRRNHPRNALMGDFGITILENYTSCGLGTFIMKELDKWAKKEKVHRIQGMVFHKNIRALGLYQKLGFEIEGMAREIAQYNNKWQHGYYIAKILD